jgi:hypothetical protein
VLLEDAVVRRCSEGPWGDNKDESRGHALGIALTVLSPSPSRTSRPPFSPSRPNSKTPSSPTPPSSTTFFPKGCMNLASTARGGRHGGCPRREKLSG